MALINEVTHLEPSNDLRSLHVVAGGLPEMFVQLFIGSPKSFENGSRVVFR